MTPKEYLLQIETLDDDIAFNEDKLARLWSRATSTTSPIDKEPGGGGITDKVGNGAAKIVDKSIREELARLKAERQKRIDLIGTVKKPLHFKVLYDYYVLRLSLVEIAAKERYSYQYIKEVHGEALKNLKI